MSKILYPKEFIANVLINEIQDVVVRHPYLAFNLICSGIEFLGRCIDIKIQKWDTGNENHNFFNGAIEELFPDKYHNLLDELRDQLRNGMIHMYTPKAKIGLTQLKHDKAGEITMDNHPVIEEERIVLVIEYFYIDFADACKKVLAMEFSTDDKMNKPFLNIPE